MGFQELTSSHGDIQISTPSSLLAIPRPKPCAGRHLLSLPPYLPLLLKAKLPLKAFWGLLTLPGSSLGEVFSRWRTMGFGNCHFAPPLVKVQMLTLKRWSLQSLSSGHLQSNAHLQTFLEEPRAPDCTPSSFRGPEPPSSKNAFYQVLQ